MNKNPEMLKFIPDHLKTKKMCKNGVKKFPFIKMHVPDQYETQKRFLENGGMLRFGLDCYKNQKMCDKAVNNYSHALEFVPDCYKTKKRVIKLLVLIFLQHNLFLNDIRLKKCVIKLLMLVCQHKNMSLIGVL